MDKNVIGLLQMMHFIEDPIKNFKKNTYEGMFRDFEETQEEVLNNLKQFFLEAEAKEKAMEEIAEQFASQVAEELGTFTKKRKQDKYTT